MIATAQIRAFATEDTTHTWPHKMGYNTSREEHGLQETGVTVLYRTAETVHQRYQDENPLTSLPSAASTSTVPVKHRLGHLPRVLCANPWHPSSSLSPIAASAEYHRRVLGPLSGQ
jgi:hypothetical protein